MKARPRQSLEGEPAAALLAWYDHNRRDLPWRAKPGEATDPYAVWLSEIMLQQTTVTAAIPYFLAFMRRWPTIVRLAESPLEEILRDWAGLGYYSRARNLHACAREIAGRPGSRFPQEEGELRALPGIGAYTAAAIAAIAFGRRALVADGNVERVVSRLCAIDDPPARRKRRVLEELEHLTPAHRAGDFAQAMMDLGATVCEPRRVKCEICPLGAWCKARTSGAPLALPVKRARSPKPQRRGAAFIVRRSDGAFLVRRRPLSGLLGGMTEFPGTDWSGEAPPGPEAAPLAAAWTRASGEVVHVFTHFTLILTVYSADVGADSKTPRGCRWSQAVDREALPSVMRKALALAGSSNSPARSTLEEAQSPPATERRRQGPAKRDRSSGTGAGDCAVSGGR